MCRLMHRFWTAQEFAFFQLEGLLSRLWKYQARVCWGSVPAATPLFIVFNWPCHVFSLQNPSTVFSCYVC